MSVIVQLSCLIDPDKKAALMPFLEKNLPNVRTFSGCLSVDVCFSLEGEAVDGQLMLLAEVWESVEHHQQYLSYISANGVMQSLRGHFIADPEIRYFEKSAC